MIDCTSANDDSELRQGDIFIYRDWPSRSDWDQIGILLTADCDIAQKKFGRFLTYLPLVSLTQYVKGTIIPNNLQKQMLALMEEISKLYFKGRRAVDPDAKPPSINVMERWVSEGEISDLNEYVKLSNAECARLRDLKSIASEGLVRHEGNFLSNQSLLKRSYGALKNKSEEQQKEFLRNIVKNSLINTSQDVYFVSSVPGIPSGLGDGLGYYVLLREVRPISMDNISNCVSDMIEANNSAIRVARLEPVFKHGLTQKFAYLFSRIGFPEEFERDQKEIIEIAYQELSL